MVTWINNKFVYKYVLRWVISRFHFVALCRCTVTTQAVSTQAVSTQSMSTEAVSTQAVITQDTTTQPFTAPPVTSDALSIAAVPEITVCTIQVFVTTSINIVCRHQQQQLRNWINRLQLLRRVTFYRPNLL